MTPANRHVKVAGCALVGVLAVAGLTATASGQAVASAQGAQGAQGAEPPTAARCAPPALAASIEVTRELPRVAGTSPADVREMAEVLRAGQAAKQPGRAQAVALSVWLGVNDPDIAEAQLGAGPAFDPATFFRRLARVADWQVLPPAIAAHRVMGTPDPYVFEAYWDQAVVLAGKLAAIPAGEVATRLTSGAVASKICRPRAKAKRGFPLPVGSGYQVAPASAAAKTVAAGEAPTLLVRSNCGTPVVSASTGVVEIERRVRTAGPWMIRVVQEDGPTTTYAHVGRPLVKDGRPVVVGDQLATVGDYGDVDSCALGFTVAIGERTLAPVEAAEWLRPVPLKPPDRSNAETTFRMASFNVLGSHLTGPGTSKPTYASGPARMAAGLALLESAGASVVAFNEFETPQASAVLGDGDWGLHRATPNNLLGAGNSGGNAIGWRDDIWELVETSEFTVPWTVTLHMPVVRLRNRETGGEVLVIAVHNPATTARAGNQAGARTTARNIEKAEVASLVDKTGLPVIIAGDFNERVEVMCDFSRSGLTTFRPGCYNGYGGVDFMFGDGPLQFVDLIPNNSTLGRISDHPLVTSQVVLNP